MDPVHGSQEWLLLTADIFFQFEDGAGRAFFAAAVLIAIQLVEGYCPGVPQFFFLVWAIISPPVTSHTVNPVHLPLQYVYIVFLYHGCIYEPYFFIYLFTYV